ncbi:MAG: hypothetical protein U1E60_27255 [Reyranellaceae bacterium]
MTEISDYSNVQNLDGRPFLGPRAPDVGLKAGGGGGTFDGMEARVAALEAHMENVRENVGLIRTDSKEAAKSIGEIKTDIATLRQKVDSLPTKEWGVNALIKLAAVMAALYVIGTAVTLFVPKFMQVTPPPAAVQKN